VIIAHRLSTVMNADRIVVIERGAICEVGSHADLLARGGVYSQLYQEQFCAFEDRLRLVEPAAECASAKRA
jgi:ABC-type multidrug transport system fused ATPase/permease subunit